jgi:hypothetical protein
MTRTRTGLVGACALALVFALCCLAPSARAADDEAAAFDSPWVVNLTDKNFDDFVTNSSSWVLECVRRHVVFNHGSFFSLSLRARLY